MGKRLFDFEGIEELASRFSIPVADEPAEELGSGGDPPEEDIGELLQRTLHLLRRLPKPEPSNA